MCEDITICIIVRFVPIMTVSETENAQNTSVISGKEGLQVTLGWPIYSFVNPDTVFSKPWDTPHNPAVNVVNGKNGNPGSEQH